MSIPKTDQAAVRQTIRALRAFGYLLVSVDDGEELLSTTTEKQALEAIMAVDEATLWVTSPGSLHFAFVRFVLGNDPEEVICDYSVKLEDALESVLDEWSA